MTIARPLRAMAFAAGVVCAGPGGAFANTVTGPAAIAAPEIGPLPTARPADLANGRKLVTDRRRGLCLLCHSGPFPEERFQGNLAPSLSGVGSRLNAGQIRLRLIDSAKINRETLMPPYFRATDQTRVGRAFSGRTILTAEEIEDVTAFLSTLTE